MTDPTDAPACEVPGCQRPQAPGWRLCRSDGEHAGTILARIGDRYAQLNANPTIQAPSGDGGHGGTLASQRNPARLEVIAIRDRRSTEQDPNDPDGNPILSVYEVLHAHAEAVREERGLTRPEVTFRTRRAGAIGPICRTCRHGSCHALTFTITYDAHLTVASERHLLAAHLDWILGQDMATDLHTDLTALWAQFGGGPRPTGHPCPDCAAELLRDNRGAHCPGCHRTWHGLALAELATRKASA